LTRFKQVVNQKSTISSAPFTTTPPTPDANVFMDELVWAVGQKFSGMRIFAANPTHPTLVSLDNKPELWNLTHLKLGPNPVTSDKYISQTIPLTRAPKNQFPDMVIFGPVHYGFQGIYNWQGELNVTPNGANCNSYGFRASTLENGRYGTKPCVLVGSRYTDVVAVMYSVP